MLERESRVERALMILPDFRRYWEMILFNQSQIAILKLTIGVHVLKTIALVQCVGKFCSKSCQVLVPLVSIIFEILQKYATVISGLKYTKVSIIFI